MQFSHKQRSERKLGAWTYNINNVQLSHWSVISLHHTGSWAIQAGLLTPLIFARHCLSPLAAFTSGAYFFTMEGGNSEFANFTLPTLKAFLEARSHIVSGNKQ